jgi:hypothetical protein
VNFSIFALRYRSYFAVNYFKAITVFIVCPGGIAMKEIKS